MRFYSDDFSVPEILRVDEFTFRPLRASDVELDFDAVVSSSSMLRAWSQSDWPIDGFTLEENLEDLQRHEQEHLDKKAFTYTIMNPEETFCLGCIYINPLSQEIIDFGVCQPPTTAGNTFTASVRFWVRESHASKEFNLSILRELDHWLEDEWYFDCVVLPVAKTESSQAKLYEEMGVGLVGDFYYKPRETYWNVYQKVIE
jgi:hypothetical protein